jgi:(1->4)-alpha-D-glucan 1-alpha-D-glucosylmutase
LISLDTSNRRALAEIDRLSPRAMFDRVDDGLPKLWTIRQALDLRRRRPDAFGPEGEYLPLLAVGDRAAQVVSFQRGTEVITVVPGLVLGACSRWRQTTLHLPPGRWRNVLTFEEASAVTDLGHLWREFPVALLERIPAETGVER